MPAVIRPNKVQFAVESTPIDRDEAIGVLIRTLESGIDDVVAGFSEHVDPEDVPSFDPHMLYATHGDGKMALVCQTTYERLPEFFYLVESVFEITDRFERGEFTVQFKIDVDVDTEDIDAPERWEVETHDIPEGSGVALREGYFEVDGGEELAERFERVREIMDEVAPDVEPAGDTPTTPVEEYYEIKYGERLADEGRDHFLQQLFHVSGSFATIDTWNTKLEGTKLEALEVSVEKEDLDADDVRSLDQRDPKFGSVPRGGSEELLATLLEGEPKLVEVEYVYEDDGERNEETDLHLVAMADGDWKIVE